MPRCHGEPNAPESGRGLPQSKTLARCAGAADGAPAFGLRPVLWRFWVARQGATGATVNPTRQKAAEGCRSPRRWRDATEHRMVRQLLECAQSSGAFEWRATVPRCRCESGAQEGGRGLPQSKTLRDGSGRWDARQLLECARYRSAKLTHFCSDKLRDPRLSCSAKLCTFMRMNSRKWLLLRSCNFENRDYLEKERVLRTGQFT